MCAAAACGGVVARLASIAHPRDGWNSALAAAAACAPAMRGASCVLGAARVRRSAAEPQAWRVHVCRTPRACECGADVRGDVRAHRQ